MDELGLSASFTFLFGCQTCLACVRPTPDLSAAHPVQMMSASWFSCLFSVKMREIAPRRTRQRTAGVSNPNGKPQVTSARFTAVKKEWQQTVVMDRRRIIKCLTSAWGSHEEIHLFEVLRSTYLVYVTYLINSEIFSNMQLLGTCLISKGKELLLESELNLVSKHSVTS